MLQGYRGGPANCRLGGNVVVAGIRSWDTLGRSNNLLVCVHSRVTMEVLLIVLVMAARWSLALSPGKLWIRMETVRQAVHRFTHVSVFSERG